ncbi:MAG: nuclear transport factor 2 family protein [Bacteroidetes bacterium]|nr:MAG: nuclear transport factor 2 family protein [Bacteroidota bacterium]
MYLLRTPTFILFYLAVFVVPLTAQSQAEQVLLDTELARFSAMVKRDTGTLNPYLHDQLYYLHSNGLTESKQEHLSAIASGKIVYQSMQRDSVVLVRRFGRTALVNSQVAVNGLFQKKAFSILLRYTAVYRKQKGRWRLLNWQSTRVDRE